MDSMQHFLVPKTTPFVARVMQHAAMMESGMATFPLVSIKCIYFRVEVEPMLEFTTNSIKYKHEEYFWQVLNRIPVIPL